MPAEYIEEDINDLALAQVLKKIYSYFKVRPPPFPPHASNLILFPSY